MILSDYNKNLSQNFWAFLIISDHIQIRNGPTVSIGMVICPKKSGEPRRTVDIQALNAHATRETYHTMSPFHQARLIPPNTKKTVLDAWNGYHSIP